MERLLVTVWACSGYDPAFSQDQRDSATMPDAAPALQFLAKNQDPPVPGAEGLAKEAAELNFVPSEISGLPFLQNLQQVVPVADLVFGGTMLIIIVLIHAAGVRAVTNHVSRRTLATADRPTVWRADMLMGSAVFMLLALHLTETVIWAAALVYGGLIANWRVAGFFAGNTYTTVGYGGMVLPPGWEMLAPIIAISGLFTFGWSGSVLVDIVARCQRIKDAANKVGQPAAGKAGDAKPGP